MTDQDAQILTAQIMTGQQVAELLQVSPRTLEEWRQTRTVPPWRRMRAGEVGTIRIVVLAHGHVQADAGCATSSGRCVA